MANLSDRTRKEQVLHHLEARKGQWVDGTELSTKEVGGSEGTRRLRELRTEGYRIEQRKHPDPERDIWQYRLTDSPEIPNGPRPPSDRRDPGLDNGQPDGPGGLKFHEMPRRLEFGMAMPCPGCGGRRKRVDPVSRKLGDCTRCNGFGLVPTRE